MSFNHYRLLIWKNFRLKLTHNIILTFEFLYPIAIVLLVIVISSSKMLREREPSIEMHPSLATSGNELLSRGMKMELCYSPSTPAAKAFMTRLENFGTDLGLNIKSFPNQTELESYLLNSNRDNVLGVYFRNTESSTSMPNKFSYILKQLMVETTERSSFLPVRDHDNHLLYFTKAQFLLNENFIEYIKPDQTKDIVTTVKQLFIVSSPDIQERRKWRVEVPFYLFLFFPLFFTSLSLMKDILEEKNSGIKEWIKITGVNEMTIWLTWFVYALSIYPFSITLSAAMMCLYSVNDFGDAAINYTPFVVIWLIWILFCMANISFCFMLTTISNVVEVVNSVFGIFYILSAFLPYSREDFLQSLPISFLCLSPVFAFLVGLEEIKFIENKEIKFTWSIFTNNQSKKFQVPFGLLYILCMLVVDSLLYLFLTYYITNINPGKFGVRKSPLFLFERLFSKNTDYGDLSASSSRNDQKYFETPSSNLEPAIRIIDLHKRFKSLHVVRGMNLVTYMDEITALLGHNGAGKTTVMSILTGLTPPSSGHVYYQDMDVFQNMKTFRSHVGLCPQENRAIPYLSVMDHLLFFGQLKGASKTEASKEAKEYLSLTGMKSKKGYKVDRLSGGMKRKFSLIIAMMGKAEVLLLDEPTSGMDAESRRSLWDFLLKLREGRSIIITTHYMEEADALGDRIAIMDRGVEVCYGSPMFLKKAFDTGYELTISKSIDNSVDITHLVQSALPSASLVSDNRREIVYKLPLTETHRFSRLFQSLESAMSQLGIQNMGVTANTIEQVFLMASSTSNVYDPKSSRISFNDADYSVNTGLRLVFQQLWAIFKKKLLFTSHDISRLFGHMFGLTIFFFLLFKYTPFEKEVILPSGPINLSLSIYPKGIVMYDEVNTSHSLAPQMEKFVVEKHGVFMKGNGSGVRNASRSLALENHERYDNDFVSGIDLSDTQLPIILMHSLKHLYSLPITVDVYSNALLRTRTNSDQYSIETTDHDMPRKNPDRFGPGCSAKLKTFDSRTGMTGMFGSLQLSGKWIFLLALITGFSLSYFSAFVIMERTNGFYHIQKMSRVAPSIYWLGTLLFDFSLFFIFAIIRSVLIKILFPEMDIIGFHKAFYMYLLMTALYGIPRLLFIYSSSCFINSNEIAINGFGISLALSVVFLVFYMSVRSLKGNPIFDALLFLRFIIPEYTYILMVYDIAIIFLKTTQCSYCVESYKALCEAEMKKIAFLEFPSDENPEALLSLILGMLAQIVLYWIILVHLVSTGFFDRLFNSSGTGSRVTDWGDDDVQQEREKIQRLKNLSSSSSSLTEESHMISMLADGLRKIFDKITVVSDASFIIERGTCFGLLGVNGAGKTTTFKMLTGEILPSSGDAQIEGFKLSANKNEYFNMAGYCPQTNCFLEELTGVEMLTIIASMRGIRAEDRANVVNEWISILALEEYKNRKCGTYSGGNKRRLCTAMSFIGDPRVVFLDEPTTGVDPLARRNLYNVMAQSKLSGQTIILTSHSMEECESICDKLTIMVSGVMKCIGSVQHLKTRYAQGFTVHFKIFDTYTARDDVSKLKQTIQEIFHPSPVILKDEHLGMLYYRITDTSLRWSVLFEKMEYIKSAYEDLVQDYVIVDTSLEEVFISFAKNR